MVRRFKVVTYSGDSLEIEIHEDKDTILVKYPDLGREAKVKVTKVDDGDFIVNIDGFEHRVKITDGNMLIDNEPSLVQKISETISTAKLKTSSVEEKKTFVKGEIAAPLSGIITEIKVNKGDFVRENDVIALLFSMKMIVEIKSNVSGYVSEIYVKPGQAVKANQLIIKINPSDKRV